MEAGDDESMMDTKSRREVNISVAPSLCFSSDFLSRRALFSLSLNLCPFPSDLLGAGVDGVNVGAEDEIGEFGVHGEEDSPHREGIRRRTLSALAIAHSRPSSRRTLASDEDEDESWW